MHPLLQMDICLYNKYKWMERLGVEKVDDRAIVNVQRVLTVLLKLRVPVGASLVSLQRPQRTAWLWSCFFHFKVT